eukprot:515768-Rhodomonas_salina.1
MSGFVATKSPASAVPGYPGTFVPVPGYPGTPNHETFASFHIKNHIVSIHCRVSGHWLSKTVKKIVCA